MIYGGADPANAQLCRMTTQGNLTRHFFALEELPDTLPPETVKAVTGVVLGAPGATASWADGAARLEIRKSAPEAVSADHRLALAARLTLRRTEGATWTETTWLIDPLDGMPLRKTAIRFDGTKQDTIADWSTRNIYLPN